MSAYSSSLRGIVGACLALALAATGGVEGRAARLNNKANDRFREGNFEAAAQLYDEAETRDPEAPAIPYNLGNALYRRGQHAEAVTRLRRSAESPDPELRRRSLYNLGNALHELGNLQEAANAYRKALALEPSDRDAKINYEKTLQELEQQQKQPQQQEQRSSSKDQQNEKSQGQGKQEQNPGQKDDPQQDDRNAKQDQQGQQGEGQGESPPEEPQQGQKNGQEGKQPPEANQTPQVAGADSLSPEDLSREEAIRILEAMREQERELQKERARKPVRSRSAEKDW